MKINYYERQGGEMYKVGLITYIRTLDETNNMHDAKNEVTYMINKYKEEVNALEKSLLKLENE